MASCFLYRRREFITLVGGAATWPLAAQESKQLRRIGVLTSDAEDDPGVKARLAAFQQGLDGLGWSLD
jgi:putative tryptophan/tyrosine transport system substrate-binding protein